MRRWRENRDNQAGMTMIVVTILGFVTIVISTTLFGEVVSELNSTSRRLRTSAASQAAEAGVDDYIAKLTEDHLYYAHYVHTAEDSRTTGGNTVTPGSAWPYALTWTYPGTKSRWRSLGNGYEYNLRIQPPTASSIGVTITATGRKAGTTKEYRAMEVVVRPASVADFQMLSATDISYGSAASTYGKIYAGVDNSGVKADVNHDGDAYADVMAEGSVTGSTSFHNGAKSYNSSTIRTVLKNPVNFNTFTISLSDIQSAAGVSGITLNDATAHGWMLQFNSNGTVSISRCTRSGSNAIEKTAPVCGTATNYNVPSNGAIYSSQSVMIKGVVKGRVTVAASGDVVIANNISLNTGGTDVLGLIATNNVIVAKWVPTNLTWYAATIAQSGQWRSYDNSGDHGTMNFYGSTATYGGGYMSMFDTRNYNYDTNLKFLQPPYFPVLEEAYTILSFRDVTATS